MSNPSMQNSNIIKRHPVVAYYVLALGISWLVEIPLVAVKQGWIDLPIPFAIHYLASYGPMLAAIVVTSLVSGSEGLKELWSRVTQWRVKGSVAAFALLSPLGLYILAAAGVGLVTGDWPRLSHLGKVNYLPNLGNGALFLWLASFGFGEEIGWRGFALPRLQNHRSARSASVILGLLWVLWHVPAFFYHETYENLGLVSLPGFAIGVLFGSILLTWLYNSANGSVLMVALWHGLFDFFTASRANPEGIAIIMSIGVIFWAIRVIKVYGAENLASLPKQVLIRSTVVQTIQPSQALRATGKTTADVHPRATSRLLFIDNIRVMLTIQVLLFHLMIIYAGTGSWFYEEGREDFVTGALGAWFVTVSQAYFMGLFLLISAYFVPGAYDRKGPGRFLKNRLIRLGIPLAIYSWIVRPPLVYLYICLIQGQRLSWWSYFPREYFRTNAAIGSGPLWFIETLLIFTVLYVLWRLVARPGPTRPAVETRFPGSLSIAIFALLLGMVSFLVRLWLPIEWSFVPLNLQFPFFAQYIALFIIGLLAYRRNWLLRLPETAGRLWLGIGVLLIFLFWPLALGGGMDTNVEPFLGGWHWQAFAYALWESFLCLGMCIGLIYAFRRHCNHQGRLTRFLSHSAYTAYIIHGPVITIMALTVRNVAHHPLLKFGLVSLVAIPLCFGLSGLIRKLPYVDRVL